MRRNRKVFEYISPAVIAIFLLSGNVTAADSKQISCSGRIVDIEGRPIEGAKVYLYQRTYNQVMNIPVWKLITESITEAGGQFLFKVPAESDVFRYGYIVAEKKGLAIGFANWRMVQSHELEIELKQTDELSGVVVDQNDKPIPGAQVNIWSLIIDRGQNQRDISWPIADELLTSITDQSGRFVFSNIPAEATAEFLVRKNGRATINTSRREIFTDKKTGFVPGQKDIKIISPVEAKINGIVVTRDTGKTTNEVHMLILRESNRLLSEHSPVSTKNDGTYSVDSLAPGKYTLELAQVDEKSADWVAEPVEVVIDAGHIESNVKIELSKGGLLEVLVTEAGAGKPVDGAGISIYNERRRQSSSGRTGSDGIGRIRLLPGVYRWGRAYKADFASAEHRDPVTIQENVTKRLQLQLSPLPKITGVLRDLNGKPIEGARLAVIPMSGTQDIKSDADGGFEVSWDPSMASDSRQAPILICQYIKGNLAAAVIIPEDKQTLDVTLNPGVLATGNVVDSDGTGIADAKIRLMLRQTMWASTISRESIPTDTDGNFEIRALPSEQRYELTISANGYGSQKVEINGDDAVDGRIKIDEIILPAANLRVSGCVVDTQGNPVANARVESYNYEGGQPERIKAQADSQGQFTLDGVCEGKLNIRVNVGQAGKRLSARVITNGGAAGITIVVREGSAVVQNLTTLSYEKIISDAEKVIAGVVLDEDGSPVKGIPVGVCCHKTIRDNGKFSWSFSSFLDLKATTDGQGRFAIELEDDGQYNLRFSPDRHAALVVYDIPVGKKDLKVILPEGGTVLGRLLRMEKGKKVPIANVEIKMQQTDRSAYTHLGFDRDRTTITDSEGCFRFEHIRTKVRPEVSRSDPEWEHVPRVWEILYGDTSKTIAFYDGMAIEDFELIIKPNLAEIESLAGRALPGFDGIEIDIPSDRTKDKAILVCFFDMNQRPSRNAIIQLNRRAEELKQKSIAVIAIQISEVAEDTLNKWVKGQGISFPAGIVRGDEEELRFTWGVKSLPWLILTDPEHIIRAEGFGLPELSDNLSQL